MLIAEGVTIFISFCPLIEVKGMLIIMNDLISIIVPIYNVEKYLRECIDSIVQQSYKDLEIILVDDGSPDGCGEICDDYAKIDQRIKVIHKQNGGLSDARNAGIEIAQGKYIGFVDSDDFIHENMFKVLHEAIKKFSVRISECHFQRTTDKNSNDPDNIGAENKSPYQIFDKVTALIKQKEYSGEVEVVVWNKLYDITLFNDIRFPKGKIHEDEYTTYKLFYKVDKIVVIDKKMYFYRQNSESIMNSNFNVKRLDIIGAYEEQLEFYKREGLLVLYDKTQFVLLNILKNYFYNIKNSGSIDDNLIGYEKYLKKTFNQLYVVFLKTQNNSLREKFVLGLFFVNPKLYRKASDYWIQKRNNFML